MEQRTTPPHFTRHELRGRVRGQGSADAMITRIACIEPGTGERCARDGPICEQGGPQGTGAEAVEEVPGATHMSTGQEGAGEHHRTAVGEQQDFLTHTRSPGRRPSSVASSGTAEASPWDSRFTLKRSQRARIRAVSDDGSVSQGMR